MDQVDVKNHIIEGLIEKMNEKNQVKNNMLANESKKLTVKKEKDFGIRDLFLGIAILIILIISTVLFVNANREQESPNPSKDAYSMIQVGAFDTCVAFGYILNGKMYRSSEIQAVNILSDTDYEYLVSLENTYTKGIFKIIEPSFYNIYLAIKDGEDIVIISNTTNGAYHVFESNLPYAFSDLVLEFEELTNTTFSHNFLNNMFQDNQNTYSGIGLFIEQHYGQHYIMYRAIVNGVEYGIRK